MRSPGIPTRPAAARRIRMLPGLALLLATGCDQGASLRMAQSAPQDREAVELAEAAGGIAGELSPPSVEPRPVEAARGLDPSLLDEALSRAAGLPRLYTMIVARHGEVEAERHFRGPTPDAPTNVKSVSKTLLSALVGIAVDEGFLEGIDQPVGPFFSEFLDAEADAEKLGITIRDLLTMQSGLESTSSGNYGRWVLSPNWVRHAITRPLIAAPGERMVYSTGNSHLLSAILTQASGQSTHAFARHRLATPLGIRLPPWLSDPQGVYFGGNDMQISARDLLRFGELYRNGGVLDGRRVLSPEWVEESWRVHAHSPRNDNVYGLGWWGRESNGYDVRFAWGFGGQFLFVIPALELTVVFTSDPVSPREGPHNRSLHELLDRYLVPAAIEGFAPVRTEQAVLQRTQR